jgi:hypothetical protein
MACIVRRPYIFVLLILALAAFATPVATAASQDDPPVAHTQAPTNVSSTSAVLRGVVDDAGEAKVTFWWELGTTTAYGTKTQTWTPDKAHDEVQRGFGKLAPVTTYHVRFVASNDHGTAHGDDMTFTTAGVPAASPIATAGAGTPAPGKPEGSAAAAETGTLALATAPELGHSVGVTAGAGTVLVRLPGSARAITLTDAAAVPIGAIIDTRRGTVQLKTELPGGKTQTGTFHAGLFEIRQPAGTPGMTELVLRGPKPTCSHGGARTAASSTRRPRRAIWGSDNHGRFRTRGSNSVATVRGTRWYMADRCDGTLTRVTQGAVSVRNLHTGRTVVVRAGHSSLSRGR